jgi:hypothetical protein
MLLTSSVTLMEFVRDPVGRDIAADGMGWPGYWKMVAEGDHSWVDAWLIYFPQGLWLSTMTPGDPAFQSCTLLTHGLHVAEYRELCGGAGDKSQVLHRLASSCCLRLSQNSDPQFAHCGVSACPSKLRRHPSTGMVTCTQKEFCNLGFADCNTGDWRGA